VNYTFLESVNLVGFLQGFVGGSWLRWDAQRADLHVAQIWETTAPIATATHAWAPWMVALARNAVGFTFFILTHIVTKKLFQVVCAKLLGMPASTQSFL
jgi:hypothetical protein